MAFRVGTGEKVRFWKDRCCEAMALAVQFPLIFSIAKDREAMVASYLGAGEVVVWDIQLRREVQD